ncbi:hypothetical protein C0J52_24312 [Blattella germanica]|nr:hypothetical protein C0J52_24312 [Blattella germanica]
MFLISFFSRMVHLSMDVTQYLRALNRTRSPSYDHFAPLSTHHVISFFRVSLRTSSSRKRSLSSIFENALLLPSYKQYQKFGIVHEWK